MPDTVYITTETIDRADVHHTTRCYVVQRADTVQARSESSMDGATPECKVCATSQRPTRGAAAELAAANPSEVFK